MPDPDDTAPVPESDRRLAVAQTRRGDRVGRYLVLHQLGAGGMGIVHCAYDPQLDRRVALKVLRADHRSERGRAIARGRLAREAQALAKLSHPNVVTVYDVGTHGEDLFVAMELVEGQTLADFLAFVPRSWRVALPYLVAAGRGLAAAHEVGVVHRDFKPSNILISSRDEVCVTDFGLARLEATTEVVSIAELEESASSSLDRGLTVTGKAVGTPGYMPPEQHAGRRPDARADQYAFGATLHETVYGRRPFGALTGEDLVRAKLRGVTSLPERDPTGGRVPRPIRRAIVRALDPDPKRRFASMNELLATLGRATRPRSRWYPLVAALGVAVFVFGLKRAGADDDPRCQGAQARVAEVWGAAPEEELRAALHPADSPIGAAALDATIGALDRYAGDWSRTHREVCEATWHRREQSTATLDRRMACLDRRLDALAATVAVLRESGPAVLPRGVDTVLALPPVDRCEGDEGEVAFPDPAEAAALRRRIDAVRARTAAAQYRRAVPDAAIVVSRARELSSDRLLAEAALVQAKVHDDVGKPDAAVEALHTAAVAARRSGHRAAEAEALLELGRITAVRLHATDRARFYLDRAEAVVDDEAALALARGRVAFVEGRDDEAYTYFETALQGREPAASTAAIRAQMAGVLLRRGELAGAQAGLEDALSTYEELFGPHHPRVAATLGNLGLVLAGRGRFDDAVDVMTRARVIYEGTFGTDHPAVATADDSLGDVLRRAGRCDEAAPRFRDAITTFEHLGVEGPRLAAPLLGLGTCTSSIPDLRRALSLLDGHGVNPIQRGDTALALAAAGAPDAEALLQRAEEDFTGLDPADDRWTTLRALQRDRETPPGD